MFKILYKRGKKLNRNIQNQRKEKYMYSVNSMEGFMRGDAFDGYIKEGVKFGERDGKKAP